MGVVELEAAAALYTGATLEPLGPFAIVERILELWLARGLPVGAAGGGSRALDRYWLHRADRLTDAERRDAYAGVFDAQFEWRPRGPRSSAGSRGRRRTTRARIPPTRRARGWPWRRRRRRRERGIAAARAELHR